MFGCDRTAPSSEARGGAAGNASQKNRPSATADRSETTKPGANENRQSHDADSAEDHAGHAHAHHAPHGGALVELGDHFAHVELVQDAADGAITLYVLDGECERAVRVAQKELAVAIMAPPSGDADPVKLVMTLAPVASALTGETAGDSSVFRGVEEALSHLPRFEAVLEKITVRGQTFENVRIEYPGQATEAGTKP